MVKDFYNKEIDNMIVVTNLNAFFFNLSYKIKNDLNIKYFFDNLLNNIKNYENLSEIEKNNFEINIKEINDLLYLFLKSLKLDYYIKEQSSENMIKRCIVFPDYGGRTIIKQLSFLPLINLMSTKIKYNNYIKENPKRIQESLSVDLNKHQEEELFDEKISDKIRKFIPDENFVNYDLKIKYINDFEAFYNEEKKENIENFIKELLKIYDNDDLNKNSIIVGSILWDNNLNKILSKFEYFYSLFKEYNDKFEIKEKESLNLMEESFFKHINNISENNVEKIKITNNNFIGSIVLTIKNDLNEEEIKEITKFFIVKNKISLTTIKLQKKENKELIFTCLLEF